MARGTARIGASIQPIRNRHISGCEYGQPGHLPRRHLEQRRQRRLPDQHRPAGVDDRSEAGSGRSGADLLRRRRRHQRQPHAIGWPAACSARGSAPTSWRPTASCRSTIGRATTSTSSATRAAPTRRAACAASWRPAACCAPTRAIRQPGLRLELLPHQAQEALSGRQGAPAPPHARRRARALPRRVRHGGLARHPAHVAELDRPALPSSSTTPTCAASSTTPARRWPSTSTAWSSRRPCGGSLSTAAT